MIHPSGNVGGLNAL